MTSHVRSALLTLQSATRFPNLVLILFAMSSVHFYSVVYQAKIDLASLSTVQRYICKCLRKRENVQSNKSEGQIASFGEQLPQKAKGKSNSKRLK